MPYIRSFKIKSLFGFRSFDLTNNDDCIILVGENGSGKSTIMNCLYYILTKNFEELVKIDFEYVEIVFNTGKKFKLYRNEIIPNQPVRLSMTEKRFVNHLNEKLTIDDFKILSKIFESNHDSELQIEEIAQLLKNKNVITSRYSYATIYRSLKALYIDAKSYSFEKTVEELSKYLYPAQQVFHLTTYRRVEAPVEDVESDDSRFDIVYGMKDVEQMLTAIQNEIIERNRIGFTNMMISLLNKLVMKEKHQDVKLDLDKVKVVLSRLGSQLSNELRNTIIEYCINHNEENSELDYLIEELIKLYEQQEDLDNSIVEFYTKCNKYLNGKQMEYDVANIKVNIRSTYNGDYIGFDVLSSGEKQMIGLMAKMYLSKEKEFVVLIDEPELSLSIKWQESILEDMFQSGKVKYMMAVTHSPFIYNNHLAKYAKGISNFITDTI